MNQSTEQPAPCPSCGPTFPFLRQDGKFICQSCKYIWESPAPADVPGVDLERLEGLYDAVPHGVCKFDARGAFVLPNAEYVIQGGPDEVKFYAYLRNTFPTLLSLAQQSATAQGELSQVKEINVRVLRDSQDLHWRLEQSQERVRELEGQSKLAVIDTNRWRESSFAYQKDWQEAERQHTETLKELTVVQAILSLRDAEVGRLGDALERILPMAKGYAHGSNVPANLWHIQSAEAALTPPAQGEEGKASGVEGGAA